MRSTLGVAVSSLFVAAFRTSVVAQQLPKSGSISVHSGYWAVGDWPYRLLLHVFNDCRPHQSEGQLHLGDTDGDRIFIDFKGAFQPRGKAVRKGLRVRV